ncbi:MAG: choice-of-anchor P family protein [Nocardioides sp.]|nr:choice-of-anchor P family protein [Nocardioides sp.]
MKRRSLTTLALPLFSSALVGAMLPLTSGAAAQAAPAEDPAFSGFSAEVWGSPIEIELYEPSIPIPSTPQAEFLLGYSHVEADSSSASGRASWLWPGDSLGEGAKTVFENLGLPPEISGPIAAQGYPIQVNSNYPSGPETHADEPFPGTVQRTGAAEDKVYATTAYSTDCEVQDADAEGGGGGGGDTPGLPGLPELPIPLLGSLTAGLTASAPAPAATTQQQKQAQAGAEEETPCPIPAALAAVVDIGGYSSTSSVVNDDKRVEGVNRSAVGEVSLLGGIVKIGSVRAKALAQSNGTKGTAQGVADYGVVTIAGQKFRFGPDGFEGGGQHADIPGLPDEPTAALAELGITFATPKPVYEFEGDSAHSSMVGLTVEIDLKTVNMVLTQLPLSDIFIELPDDLGPLKSALLSAANLASRVKINLAVADGAVDTVQGIDIPTPTPEPEAEPEEESDGAGGGNTGGGTGGVAAPPAGTSTPTVPGADGAPVAGQLPVDAALTSGLPKLFSIPGLLLVAGLLGAGLVGSYMRRIGALALGGGAACSHGLDSGLPDLRKA